MFFNKQKGREQEQAKLPHEIFPDILFQEKGDRTDWGNFVSISEDGTIFFETNCGLKKRNIKQIVSANGVYNLSDCNLSLNQRKLQEELNNQKTDYFQYIQDFKNAYKEIKGENND